jgi:VIT1/CCC1 family predicted Fe2+/Mn2+ transporter
MLTRATREEVDDELPDAPRGPERGSYLSDTVYGALDGAVTTFAIVAGVAGAGLSPRVIVALGLANVLADGFSMAAGNYSGTKAERDDIARLRQLAEERARTDPAGERRVLRTILSRKGLSGRLLEEATDAVAADREAHVEMILVDGHGLSPVEPHPFRSALATFVAFLAAGMVPLVPFLFGAAAAFQTSIWLTAAVFFAIGALKSRWSLAPWWRSGLETLAIGGVAAIIAYGVARLVEV